MNRNEYYLSIAEIVSKKSTCLKRQYGAVIVKLNRIISTGFNGAPCDVTECTSIGSCPRINVPHNTDYTSCRAVHAEQNAIIQASMNDMNGATLYLYGTGDDHEISCCPMCKRMIINAHINKVIAYSKRYDYIEYNREDFIRELNEPGGAWFVNSSSSDRIGTMEYVVEDDYEDPADSDNIDIEALRDQFSETVLDSTYCSGSLLEYYPINSICQDIFSKEDIDDEKDIRFINALHKYYTETIQLYITEDMVNVDLLENWRFPETIVEQFILIAAVFGVFPAKSIETYSPEASERLKDHLREFEKCHLFGEHWTIQNVITNWDLSYTCKPGVWIEFEETNTDFIRFKTRMPIDTPKFNELVQLTKILINTKLYQTEYTGPNGECCELISEFLYDRR